MSVLRSDSFFDYVVLTPERSAEAGSVIAESFADEPTGIFLESDRSSRLKQMNIFTAYFADACAENGVSVACIERESGILAGVVYLRDFKETFPDVPMSELPCLEPVVSILLQAEEDYEERRPGLQLGDCVDIWMLGVHRDYRRRNIAQILTQISIAHAFEKGFKLVILESTGKYSASCAESAGMSIAIRKVYNEQSHSVLKDMPLEHPALLLWEVVMA